MLDKKIIATLAMFVIAAAGAFVLIADGEDVSAADDNTVTYKVGNATVMIDPISDSEATIYNVHSLPADYVVPAGTKFVGWTTTETSTNYIVPATADLSAYNILGNVVKTDDVKGQPVYAILQCDTYSINVTVGDATYVYKVSSTVKNDVVTLPRIGTAKLDGTGAALSTIAIPSDTAEREGVNTSIYTGWNIIGADGATTAIDLKTSTIEVFSDLDIKANFETVYVATWYVNGAKISTTNTYDLKASAPADPVSKGLMFDGWAVDGVIVDLATFKATEDVELTAQFSAGKITVTFVDAEGNVLFKKEVLNGQTLTDLPEAPEGTAWDYDGSVITDALTITAVSTSAGDDAVTPSESKTDDGDSSAIIYAVIAVFIIGAIVASIVIVHRLQQKKSE